MDKVPNISDLHICTDMDLQIQFRRAVKATGSTSPRERRAAHATIQQINRVKVSRRLEPPKPGI